jgi:uncharacterized membrane-anchored protein YhcB (DUF1043 family)
MNGNTLKWVVAIVLVIVGIVIGFYADRATSAGEVGRNEQRITGLEEDMRELKARLTGIESKLDRLLQRR